MSPEFDEYELTQALADTAAGLTTLSEFAGWFLPRAWNFNDLESSALGRMVGAVKLVLYEHTSGGFPRDEVLLRFREIAEGKYD